MQEIGQIQELGIKILSDSKKKRRSRKGETHQAPMVTPIRRPTPRPKDPISQTLNLNPTITSLMPLKIRGMIKISLKLQTIVSQWIFQV